MPATLSPAQEQVITLLSTGSTLTAAAAAAGIHRNTIANWRRASPGFSHALTDASYDRILYFRDLSEAHAELAISTLRDLLTDPKTPASVRLKAALAILKECTTLPIPPPMPAPELDADRQLCTPAVPEMLHNPAQSPSLRTPAPKPGRNQPCPCHSGKKYKLCCLSRLHRPAVPASMAA